MLFIVNDKARGHSIVVLVGFSCGDWISSSAGAYWGVSRYNNANIGTENILGAPLVESRDIKSM